MRILNVHSVATKLIRSVSLVPSDPSIILLMNPIKCCNPIPLWFSGTVVMPSINKRKTKKLRGLSPRANYTD
jgi:hypothetical protein